MQAVKLSCHSFVLMYTHSHGTGDVVYILYTTYVHIYIVAVAIEMDESPFVF